MNLDDGGGVDERREGHREASDGSCGSDRQEPFFPSFASAFGGSSGRRRRMGFYLSVSRRSTGLCRAAGSRGALCTKSWEWAATRRMARSPPPLPRSSWGGLRHPPSPPLGAERVGVRWG